MPLDWTLRQRAKVETVFAQHPVESKRCMEAARGVLPVAQQRDLHARARVLRSDGLVLPREGPPWFHHHVATLTRSHDLDAFTGADGCPDEEYLERHWQFPDVLEWKDIDIMTEEPR